jgi:hypothetical protein
MSKDFQLKRTKQCAKCPWKISTNPRGTLDIDTMQCASFEEREGIVLHERGFWMRQEATNG